MLRAPRGFCRIILTVRACGLRPRRTPHTGALHVDGSVKCVHTLVGLDSPARATHGRATNMPSVSGITIGCARGSSIRARPSATQIRATGAAMRAHRTSHTYNSRPSEMTGSTRDPVPLQVECARRRNRGILCACFSPRPKPSPSQYSRACSSSASYLPTAPRRRGRPTSSHACDRPALSMCQRTTHPIACQFTSRPFSSHHPNRPQWRAPATASLLPSVAPLDWRGEQAQTPAGNWSTWPVSETGMPFVVYSILTRNSTGFWPWS